LNFLVMYPAPMSQVVHTGQYCQIRAGLIWMNITPNRLSTTNELMNAAIS